MTNVIESTESADAEYLPEAADTTQWSGETVGSTRWRWISDPTSRTPILVGLGIVIAGFVLILFGWAQVAGTADVWRQFPYLLSAGIPGLGLIMIGLVVINVTVRRNDGAQRAEQLSALRDALRDLQRALDQL